MSNYNYDEQMEIVIKEILSNSYIKNFHKYWYIAEKLIDKLPIRSFYSRSEENYVNLAILTDKLVIDIEKNNDEQNSGQVSSTAVRYISDVFFCTTPIITIPISRDSSLTVIASRIGETGIGPFWIAKSEKEYEELIQFGKAITTAINELS